MTEQARYRVEHHANGTVAVLGVTDDWALTALAPYAVELLAQHETGQLVLIEQATGRAVDRRRLWPEASEQASEGVSATGETAGRAPGRRPEAPP
jgi:hypothetical protein